MATAVVNMKTTTETQDVAYGYKIDGEKKEPYVTDPDTAEKLGDKFSGTVVTVSVDYPATFDDLVTLANTPVKDDEGNTRDQNDIKNELVKLFRAGAKIKVNNRRNALLTKTDDQGNLTFSDESLTNGVLDLTSEITSGSKRVFLTEEEKVWRSLANLPDMVRKTMYDTYLTSIGKQAGSYPED